MTKVVTLLFALASVSVAQSCARRVAVYEIPADFVGWVTIRYEAKDCPPEKSLWTSVIRVRPDGSGCAAKWNGAEGLAFVRYFYVDSSGRRIRELKHTGWGEGGELWAGAISPDKKESYTFVGTEKQFKDPKYHPRR